MLSVAIQATASSLRCSPPTVDADSGNSCLRMFSALETEHRLLEAQQQYLSYRAVLVAIVSQNSFVFVFVGYSAIITQYVAQWGIAAIAQMCQSETKCQGGDIAPILMSCQTVF